MFVSCAQDSDEDDIPVPAFRSENLPKEQHTPVLSCTSDSDDDEDVHMLRWLRADNQTPPRRDAASVEVRSPTTSQETHASHALSWQDINVDEILARRKRDEQLHARLEEVLRPDYRPSASDTTSSESSDGDLKYLLEKAKEMRIEDPTVTGDPNYEMFNCEWSCMIFNHETLQLKSFVDCDKFSLPAVLSDSEDVYKIMEHQIAWCGAEEERLCTFFFYLMSVHPSVLIIETCYDFLQTKPSFRPCITVIINVLENWSVDLDRMFRVVPELFENVSREFKECPRTRRDVGRYNISCVFNYLKEIVLFGFPDAYCLLVEPLMRIALDKKIFGDSEALFPIFEIIKTITSEKEIALKDLHLQDLTLLNQTVLYTKVCNFMPWATSLAFATAQQFLDSNIEYHENVDMEKVYEFFVSKSRDVLNSNCHSISCYVRIISELLYPKVLVDPSTHHVNCQDWIDLLSEWCRRVPDSEHTADTILMKEQIAITVYHLRMKITANVKQECDLNSTFMNV